jgi:serine/threonine protein kinase
MVLVFERRDYPPASASAIPPAAAASAGAPPPAAQRDPPLCHRQLMCVKLFVAQPHEPHFSSWLNEVGVCWHLRDRLGPQQAERVGRLYQQMKGGEVDGTAGAQAYVHSIIDFVCLSEPEKGRNKKEEEQFKKLRTQFHSLHNNRMSAAQKPRPFPTMDPHFQTLQYVCVYGYRSHTLCDACVPGSSSSCAALRRYLFWAPTRVEMELKACLFIRQLCVALQAHHQAHVLLGDIKPGNTFLHVEDPKQLPDIDDISQQQQWPQMVLGDYGFATIMQGWKSDLTKREPRIFSWERIQKQDSKLHAKLNIDMELAYSLQPPGPSSSSSSSSSSSLSSSAATTAAANAVAPLRLSDLHLSFGPLLGIVNRYICTREYRPPEAGSPHDGNHWPYASCSDVYSLGLTLLQVLEGRPAPPPPTPPNPEQQQLLLFSQYCHRSSLPAGLSLSQWRKGVPFAERAGHRPQLIIQGSMACVPEAVLLQLFDMTKWNMQERTKLAPFLQLLDQTIEKLHTERREKKTDSNHSAQHRDITVRMKQLR